MTSVALATVQQQRAVFDRNLSDDILLICSVFRPKNHINLNTEAQSFVSLTSSIRQVSFTVSAFRMIMRSTNEANQYFSGQTQGGAQSKLQSLMSKLYCVTRQCSTRAVRLLLGSKMLWLNTHSTTPPVYTFSQMPGPIHVLLNHFNGSNLDTTPLL